MIVHDPAAHHTPTPSQLETWDAERRQDVALQLARLEQRKAEDWASAAASAAAAVTTATTATPVPQDATLAATIQQKRAEREARRQRQLAAAGTSDAATGPAASGASIPGSEERERDGAAPASDTTTTTNTANNANAVYTVSVPTTSDAFAWYDYDHNNSDNKEHDDPDPQQQQPRTVHTHTHTHTYETLDAARTAGVWVYPSSAEERARCEVFRDLWEQGYFMGGGSKFGGDWLVYPGACAPIQTCSQPYHSFTLFHRFSRAHTHRRSAALSFALCCHRATLPICPAAPDGSGGAWSTWHGHEKGASFVWLGPCQPRSHVHQHRVGRIRIGVGFFLRKNCSVGILL